MAGGSLRQQPGQCTPLPAEMGNPRPQPPLLPSRPRPARLGPGYLLTAAHPTARVTGIIVMKIIAMENIKMMTVFGCCALKLYNAVQNKMNPIRMYPIPRYKHIDISSLTLP